MYAKLDKIWPTNFAIFMKRTTCKIDKSIKNSDREFVCVWNLKYKTHKFCKMWMD